MAALLVSPIPRPIARTDFELVFDGSTQTIQRWFIGQPKRAISGSRILSLFLQLRDSIPYFSRVPIQEGRCYPIQFELPDHRSIEVPLGALLIHLIWIEHQLSTLEQKRLTQSADDFVDVSRGEVPLAHLGGAPTFWERLSSWVIDPKHPSKLIKYMYPLSAISSALNHRFPGWRADFLPQLTELGNADSFAQHAAAALSQLGLIGGDVRKRYFHLGAEIRGALQEMGKRSLDKPILVQAGEMILQLCHFKFTQVYFYRFFDDFIPKCLSAKADPGRAIYEFPTLTWKNFGEELRRANIQLEQIPHYYTQTQWIHQMKSLQGAIGINFDPNGRSNPPWVHSIQVAQEGHRCTVLRHATPTRDSVLGFFTSLVSSSSSEVIPEYEAHLLANPRLTTLYCSHQYNGDRAESARNRAIRSLEEKHKNFCFIACPMDGPLWDDPAEIKWKILESLSKEENGFILPSKPCLRQKVIEGAPHLLNEIERLYFKNHPPEEAPLKKAFLLLFYSELKDFLKGEIQADYVVSACKDHKDRGNVSVTVDMMKNLMKLGRENDPALLREVFISVLSPFIIKNQHILPERLVAALAVIQLFSHLSEKEKEAIRQTPLTRFQIQDQYVPKEEGNWTALAGKSHFVETVETARRLDEVREISDPDYQRLQMEIYKKGTFWHLAKLKRQIVKDLPRIDLRMNGERIVQFARLCEILTLDPSIFEREQLPDTQISSKIERGLGFLTMLHQGAVFKIDEDVHHYFMDNLLDFHVVPGVVEPARRAIQELILSAMNGENSEQKIASYSNQWPDRFPLYLKSAVALQLLPSHLAPDGIRGGDLIQIYPTRVTGLIEKGNFHLMAEQELMLSQVAESHPHHYPILGRTVWREGGGAKHSWKFI